MVYAGFGTVADLARDLAGCGLDLRDDARQRVAVQAQRGSAHADCGGRFVGVIQDGRGHRDENGR